MLGRDKCPTPYLENYLKKECTTNVAMLLTLLKSTSAPAGPTGWTNASGVVKLGIDTVVVFIVGVAGKAGNVISDGRALFKLVILAIKDCMLAYITTK